MVIVLLRMTLHPICVLQSMFYTVCALFAFYYCDCEIKLYACLLFVIFGEIAKTSNSQLKEHHIESGLLALTRLQLYLYFNLLYYIVAHGALR